MRYRFLILFIFLSFSGFAQNRIVTDFKDSHQTTLSLYFYPSTLRMVNIERNQEYDEMIKNVKKARYFKLDSGAVSRAELSELSKDLEHEGFEEVMFIKNKDTDIRVWGVEKRDPELVVLSRSQEGLMLFEIIGMINITKIPKLTQTFNQSSFLDVLNLNKKKK